MRKTLRRFLLVVLILGVAATVASAQTQTVYNTAPKPLPGNVVSVGFECCAVQEFGDAISLANAGGGLLGQVSVNLSVWACQRGNVYGGNCSSDTGATFSQPITINVYGVGFGPTLGLQLGSITQNFNLPYRPTSSPGQCGGDNTRWYSSKDKTCYHGLAVPITVNFSTQHITVPGNSQLIVTVAYNTTDFGLNPIGPSPCRATTQGCPYDSLNVSADTTDGTFNFVGNPLDTNTIWVRPAGSPYAYSACAGYGTMVPGVLAPDNGCWAGYHPEISVQVNTNSVPHSKGSGL